MFAYLDGLIFAWCIRLKMSVFLLGQHPSFHLIKDKRNGMSARDSWSILKYQCKRERTVFVAKLERNLCSQSVDPMQKGSKSEHNELNKNGKRTRKKSMKSRDYSANERRSLYIKRWQLRKDWISVHFQKKKQQTNLWRVRKHIGANVWLSLWISSIFTAIDMHFGWNEVACAQRLHKASSR